MRALRCAAVFALLFLTTHAFAVDLQVPPQNIVGADQVILPGELVDLSLSPIGTKPDNLIGVSAAWRVFDMANGREKRVREYSGKDLQAGGIFFSSGLKKSTLKAVCAVTYLYAVKGEAGIKEVSARTILLFKDVVIDGEEPSPTPPTPPAPKPDPVFPAGTYGLSKFTYDAAKVIPEDGRKETAQALADCYEGTIASIAAGVIPASADKEDLQKVLNNTATCARSAIQKTSGNIAWKQWSQALQDKTYELYASGKMKTVTEFKTAWEEIRDGLRAVR